MLGITFEYCKTYATTKKQTYIGVYVGLCLSDIH
jgi:hypothetical protein